jgi:uracil-DNA glycosylase family 4
MHISANLCALALKGLVGGACKAVGVEAGEGAVTGVVSFLMRHFVDHSSRLIHALRESNERAWRALEVALAGDGLWDRCKLVLASGDEKAFREQVRPFLDSCNLAELQGRDTYRQACLTELRAARKAGLLTEGNLEPRTLAQRAGAFARYSAPEAVLDAEQQTLTQMGDELRRAGHANLGAFVELRPRGGDPLLVAAARYFFRRAIETDEALFQGLAFARLERLQETTEAGFAALEHTLQEQGERLELVLGEVHAAVIATRDAVLDVRAEQTRQSAQARDIYQAVIDLQGRLDLMNREVRAHDSLSLRNDHERALVKQLVARYRDLPDSQRERMPALLNAIGQLEVAAGDFQSARKDFAAVVNLTGDQKARAEAHANAYRAALEARDWDTALAELRQAVQLDAARFAPFPLDKYRPQRILGAGGFGVAFLCEHRFLKAPVVVKTLSDADLDRGVDTVFAEAQVLRQLDHPAIIRLQDCGFGGPDGETRPYLVMDYFAGTTLEDAVRDKPLGVDDAVSVARQIAAGLQAAHSKGILHRDVKPANLLVAREGSRSVKLIDFGLALRRTGRETMLATSSTLVGSSIAGTLDYAAPEQMGKSQAPVGPHSDVYGFARTLCFALFQTPQPLMRHWRSLPPALAELLESCLEEDPKQRPADFAAVLGVLDRLGGAPAPAVPSPTPVPAVGGDESRRRELATLAGQVAGCTRCPALVRARRHAVFGAGPLSADLFFIGEAPGAEEDREGRPFIGASGQLLLQLLTEVGIDLNRVFLTNALKCRPPGRKGEAHELSNCREHLMREIEIVQPKVIVCLGAPASQTLLNTAEFIGKLRGRVQRFRNTPVVCTYHPAYLLRNATPQNRQALLSDLRLALRQVAA